MVKMRTVKADSFYDSPRTVIESPDDDSWLDKYDRPQDKIRDRVQDTVRDTIRDTPRDDIRDTVRDRTRPNLSKDTVLQPPVERVKPPNPYRVDPPPAPKKRWGLPPFVGVQPMQKGLVPVGNTGLYTTPDEPADPRDCNRYPSSFYCGGVPLAIEPIALDPEVVVDSCNNIVGVAIVPTLGFVQLPPVQVVIPNKNCKEEKVKPPKGIPYSPPPPPPSICRKGTMGWAFFKVNWRRTHWSIAPPWSDTPGKIYSHTEYGIYNWHKPVLPGKPFPANNLPGAEIIYPPVEATVNIKSNFNPTLGLKVTQTWGYKGDNYYFTTPVIVNGETVGHLRFFSVGSAACFGECSVINEWLKTANYAENWVGEGGGVSVYSSYQMQYWVTLKGEIIDIDPLPPPPPPPDRRCCMSCCPNNNGRNDDALLQLIYRKVIQIDERVTRLEKNVGEFPVTVEYFDANETLSGRQARTISIESIADSIPTTFQRVENVAKIIGIEELPTELPESFITKDEGFVGNLIPNGTVKKRNLVQILEYSLERFDEIMGEYEVPIEVKDSDPNTPGDQPVGMRIGNVSEGIGEMMMLLLKTVYNSELLVNLSTKILLESGQIKKQDYTNFSQLEAILDYLGCAVNQEPAKLPIPFTLNAQSMEEMLENSEADVTVYKLKEKGDLKDIFRPLLESASITKAVHWRKFDIKGDLKEQFKSMIRNYAATADAMERGVEDENGKDDFDRFIEDAEQGFINEPGIHDSVNPYGRDYSRRPRIKEIGVDTSDLNT